MEPTEQKVTTKKSNLRLPLTIGCLLTGVPLVVLLALAYPRVAEFIRLLRRPELKAPVVKMPSPNAYDFYVRAAKLARDSEKISDATANPRTSSLGAPSSQSTPHVYVLAEKATLVKRNEHALRELRRGFAYPCVCPPFRSMTDKMQYPSKIRTPARLLALEAQLKAAHGDWAGSMESCLDGLRLGEDVPTGGALIPRLVGIALQAIGRREAWNAVDHLTAGQALAAAHRLEGILEVHAPFSDTLQEEKYYSQAALMQMLEGKGPLHGSDKDIDRALAKCPGFLKRMAVNRYCERMDEYIVSSRKPYAARPRVTADQRRAMNPLTVLPDALSWILLPVFDKAGCVDTRNEAQNKMLLAALALRSYRLEHFAYPESLSHLTPVYLKKLPDDPFALKGTFHYKRNGAKYLLYSLGPDCKDDGGKPIDNLRGNAKLRGVPTARERYNAQPGSKGDIVLGVNTF